MIWDLLTYKPGQNRINDYLFQLAATLTWFDSTSLFTVGYLKFKVFFNRRQFLEQLKANIRNKIVKIEPGRLKKAMENAEKRSIIYQISFSKNY